jgi:O-acetyl-ADP-ribose deacetylase (regulator of RNase III)/uncharacterized protein YwgA
MVRVVIGNLLDSKAQTLVNTVNCVGIMGKGIALQFKEKFPEYFKDYERRCKSGRVKLGQPYIYQRLTPPWIVSFPTKDHWRSVARLSDIIAGLDHLLYHYQDWGIKSIAIPPLGCGNGELEWRVVGPTIYRYVSQMNIDVELYAPHGTPHAELQVEFLAGGSSRPIDVPEAQWIKPAHVALVEVVDRIQKNPYHSEIGRTVFQKIAYFATDQGIPTGLHFDRSSFGPFSKGLRKLETRLVNNGLVTERWRGKTCLVQVGPTFADAQIAYQRELEEWQSTIIRLADLFQRTDTTGAELLATVVFAARDLAHQSRDPPDEQAILNEVLAWKGRRTKPPSGNDVAYAIRFLANEGWIAVRRNPQLPISAGERYWPAVAAE